MKYFIGVLTLVFALSFNANSQDANKILSELSAKAKNYKTISASYSSELIDTKNGINFKQDGSIKIKGEKYYLDLSDYIIISDATTIWTYETESNICTIDDAEEMEEEGFNPSKMFTIWEQDFRNEYKNESTLNGKKVHVINLYPNNAKDAQYHTITLFIDKTKMEVVKIVAKSKEGSEMTYTVKSFNTNIDLPDATFELNKADFPGVELEDNRI